MYVEKFDIFFFAIAPLNFCCVHSCFDLDFANVIVVEYPEYLHAVLTVGYTLIKYGSKYFIDLKGLGEEEGHPGLRDIALSALIFY